MHDPIPNNSLVSRGILGARYLASLALLAAALGAAPCLAAQSPVVSAPRHKSVHYSHKIPATAQSQPQTTEAAPAPAAPPVPEAPAWPANDKPTPATITWNSQGLRIDADNSSLKQILNDMAIVTGTTVEGLDADQRVFGAYGPAPASVVLSQLLQGSGYNIVMSGDQGQGTPRLLVLSSRHASGGTQPTAGSAPASDEDVDTDEQPQPQNPPPVRSAFAPGGPTRTPQQMQELQQRQQQMLLQRQQSGRSADNSRN